MGQWHFHLDNTPVHNSILVTDYLTKMGIKIVPHPPYSPDLAPCDFWLFPKLNEKLRGCRYETIEEMKEAVTKVIDTLTQEDFHEAFQKLLERYNKCIAAGGDYFEGDKSFMCVLSIKVPIRKSLETYLMILVYIYIYIYIYINTHWCKWSIYIYIYIVIHRQTVWLYHNLSMWLDTWDASSWDQYTADFTSDGYLTPKCRTSHCKWRNLTYIFIYIYVYRLLECSFHEKSFAFTRM